MLPGALQRWVHERSALPAHDPGTFDRPPRTSSRCPARPARTSQAFLPTWGRVVFISSESALNIPADMIHYGFTKTAMLALSRGLAKMAAGTGVTVNSVLPGPTMSEGVGEMLKEMAEEQGLSIEAAGVALVKSQRPSSILQRPASVEEVANMIVDACSMKASATTGAALRVDGGVVDSIVP
ncbi:SDR family NAD(P)-dependent oxidoreductase [Jiella sp. M17.18]|uniref:SDR family NAD(P)-dependent oxidoreductase n=1 Tax=Jiella sp. M17.18 TaxID=3234247 RepID=UPI0034DF7DA2